MSEKKSTKAKSKKASATTEPKAKKEKPPRESREGWGVFALRMPVEEREALHKAAGPGGASRLARAVLAAFASEDEAAFRAAVAEARTIRA